LFAINIVCQLLSLRLEKHWPTFLNFEHLTASESCKQEVGTSLQGWSVSSIERRRCVAASGGATSNQRPIHAIRFRGEFSELLTEIS